MSAIRESIGPRLGATLLCTATFLACDSGRANTGTADAVGGTIIIAVQSEPRTLLPPLITFIDEKTVADQIFEPLAWLGDEGRLDSGYRPALADTWSWSADSMAIEFHLNPRAQWHDGVAVRASDVVFTHALYADSLVGFKDRPSLAHIDSVTARDSLTPVFWFNARYPDQFFDAAARMLIVPEHVLAREPRATLLTSSFGRQPVGSGRFRFVKWDAGQSLEVVADTANYRGRPNLDRVIFTMVSDPNAIAARLTSGELDLADVSNAELFKSVAGNPDIKARINPAYDYTFLLFNTRAPKQRQRPNALFADIGLRRAIAMSLDVERLVSAQFDSLAAVAVGPMTRVQPLADTTIQTIRYDSAGAARLLDSLGWTLPAGKPIRERNGRPLAFAILTPSVSPNRMRMVVAIQAALRKVGIDATVDAVDGNAYGARLRARDFDVEFDGRRVEMSLSGLRASWTVASARDPKGANYSSYENRAFDAHLDSALAAADMAHAKAHAHEAYQSLVADVPAVWIYEARTATLMHKRIHPVHITPTAWWTDIADWSIPPDERLPRDRVGVKVAAR